jgi:hypothetical protein
MAGHLPAEAAEALLQAATGVRPEEPPVAASGDDPFAHPDAGRRFRTFDGLEELEAALDAPWERWAVYLHPSQREYVDRNFNGPARVASEAAVPRTVMIDATYLKAHRTASSLRSKKGGRTTSGAV